jgi:hypothetical protein
MTVRHDLRFCNKIVRAIVLQPKSDHIDSAPVQVVLDVGPGPLDEVSGKVPAVPLVILPRKIVGEIPEELVEVIKGSGPPRERRWQDWEWRDDAPAPRRKRGAEPGEAAIVRVSPGDRVYHEAFGPGTVKEVTGSGSDAEVSVDFDEEGTKRLMLAYANLTRAY